jgi:hypothetical protein
MDADSAAKGSRSWADGYDGTVQSSTDSREFRGTRRIKMITRSRIALRTILACVAFSLPLVAQERIPVFLKSAQTSGGFTDPSKDRQDSTNDLAEKLRDSKAVRQVESEVDAVIVLEVLGRETKRESNLNTALFGSRQNRSYLTVRLTAGEYSAEFQGESGSKGVLTGYGDAASKVVKQLDDWVKANRDKLLALKKR